MFTYTYTYIYIPILHFLSCFRVRNKSFACF